MEGDGMGSGAEVTSHPKIKPWEKSGKYATCLKGVGGDVTFSYSERCWQCLSFIVAGISLDDLGVIGEKQCPARLVWISYRRFLLQFRRSWLALEIKN